jgi:Rab family protein
MTDSTPVKLVLLGDTEVGKTSIVSQYLSGSIPESLNSTIGAAFVTKTVTFEKRTFELLIWDTAGQEVYRGLAPMYYRSAAIALIVYDITNAESYNAVDFWIRELRANVEESIVILVCGNKIDLEDRRLVDGLQASAAAVEKGCLYAEASAVTGAGVEKAFQATLTAYVKSHGADQPARAGGRGMNIDDKAKKQESDCC